MSKRRRNYKINTTF